MICFRRIIRQTSIRFSRPTVGWREVSASRPNGKIADASYFAYNERMQPEIPQPIFSAGPEAPKTKSRKKVIIISIVSALIVLIGGAAAYMFFKPTPAVQQQNTPNSASSKFVEFGAENTAFIYAGHKMYDACNVLPQSLLEKHVEGYKDVYEALGTDRILQNPVNMEHGYIDRNIPSVLGKDGQAREPSISISADKVDSTVRARSFMTLADSHCTYASGIAYNLQYVQVHIIQPPTPLHPKLLTLLDSLKQRGQMIIELQGVQVYLDVEEGDSEIVMVLKRGDVVMFVASKYKNLIQEASDMAVAVLAKEPTGPMTAKYPAQYAGLINPCTLFTADDFEKTLGKKADSITGETLNLTETDKNYITRVCTRYEIERLKEGEVTNSRITLGEARTENDAKAQINGIKAKNPGTLVSGLGDEAYLLGVPGDSLKPLKLLVRSGKQVLEIASQGEAKDTSAETFSARTLPVAKIVLDKLKR